jgi:hypothetical protein
MAKLARLEMGEVERWLAQLDPADSAAVRAALKRDGDLRDEVEVLLEELPEHLREAFLERFGPAVEEADRPAAAVFDGLKGIIRARLSGLGFGEREPDE